MKTTKKSNVFVKAIKKIANFFDRILITPISKLAYFIKDKFSFKSGFIDRMLNKPNVLLYISLILAFTMFMMVQKNFINFSDTKAITMSNLPVEVEYNDEAYVIEGLPTKADLVLLGKKSELYLAEQYGDHKVTLDLTGLDVGTHKVTLDYNNPIRKLNYILDPGTVTIVIYPKVSEVRTLSIDVINTDKLDETLVVSNVLLDRNDVIIKSYKEKLNTVANVKAIVDVNSLNATESGTYTIDNVKLVAYDDKGKEISGIEVVPGQVTATVTITSPSKTVPLKIVPVGEVRSGSAISSITSSVTNVIVYADESVLKDINYIEVEIDVNGISSNKTYQKVINKPQGARSISDTSVTINVTMEEETSKDFMNISVETEGLNEKFKASGATENDARVTVSVRGVGSLLEQLQDTDIKAYIDLSGITEPGTYNVPVYVTGSDVKLTYTSKTKQINVVVQNK
jgi:YbbR domain-containing protein